MLLIWAVMGNLKVPREDLFLPLLVGKSPLPLTVDHCAQPLLLQPFFGPAQQNLWGLYNHYACIGT